MECQKHITTLRSPDAVTFLLAVYMPLYMTPLFFREQVRNTLQQKGFNCHFYHCFSGPLRILR